jgi:hypothetical protein
MGPQVPMVAWVLAFGRMMYPQGRDLWTLSGTGECFLYQDELHFVLYLPKETNNLAA